MHRQKHTSDEQGDTIRASLHETPHWTRNDTGKPHNYLIKKLETRVSSVQRTERQTIRCKVPTVKNFIAKKLKVAYREKAATKIGMSGLEFHVYLNELLRRTSKFRCCLVKLVSLSLRERILYAKQYSRVAV